METNILLILKIYNISENCIKNIKEIINILTTLKCNIYMQNILKNVKEYENLIDKNIIFVENNLFNKQIDLCITYGGDGTILHANKYFYNEKISPLYFTINGGTLGFLCNFYWEKTNTKSQLKNYFNNNYETIKYNKIKVNINDKSYYIINEIVLERDDIKVLNLDISINGNEFIENLVCDGILVSSGLGSTGYNSSINGSYLSPNSNCLILNSIAPFGKSFKPLILNKYYKIQVKFNKNNYSDARIVLDGIEKIKFSKEDTLEIEMDNSIFQEIKNTNTPDNWIDSLKQFYK